MKFKRAKRAPAQAPVNLDDETPATPGFTPSPRFAR